MKLTLFSVFDSKAEAFIQPFFSLNTGTGKRAFKTAANDPKADFHINAGDYTLFELGTFDQNTGKFEILESPENHGMAITYRTNAAAAAMTEGN